MALRLPKTVRSIGRVQTIVGVLTHHGFGHLVDRLQLGRYIPLPKRWQASVPTRPELAGESIANTGRRIVSVCEDLGPTFVKLGQILSTRSDLLPAEIINELARLQDTVPPFDTNEAKRIIEKELGTRLEECYAEFDETPMASGSIAQVHTARTISRDDDPGQRVVVKVKRPDIEDTIRLDMTILKWIADVAERLTPELAVYRPRLIVEEFERNLLRELDFVNEAAAIGHFGESLGKGSHLCVPAVHWDLTSSNVLTLERLQGKSLQRILSSDDPSYDRPLLASRLAEGFLKQFFETGLFHGDPHPGNLLIEPPATIGLIDFGLTGQLDDTMLGHLTMALLGAINREPQIIVEVLADMDALGDHTDARQLRRDFMNLIEKYYGLPLQRFDMQTLFYEVTDLIRRNDVTLPRDFVIFGKALVAIGGICLQLDPKMDLVALLKPRLLRLIGERLSPGRVIKSAAITGWHLINLLQSAPGHLRDMVRRLSRGKWQVNIRHQNLDHLASEIDRASNRLGFAVIIGATIMGSSWILTAGIDKIIFGSLPLWVLGVAGYLAAGVMGLWLVIAILRSGRLS